MLPVNVTEPSGSAVNVKVAVCRGVSVNLRCDEAVLSIFRSRQSASEGTVATASVIEPVGSSRLLGAGPSAPDEQPATPDDTNRTKRRAQCLMEISCRPP